jgi:hypothetical protein
MKKFIAVLTVLAALLSCKADYTIEVRNNSSYAVTAIISAEKTLDLPSGKSEEIDRWESIKSFTANPPRASMRMSGDDYEFYDTPVIDLNIYNLAHSLTSPNKVYLYTSGSTDEYTDPVSPVPEDPITFTGSSPSSPYKIYTTTPTLRAVVVVPDTSSPPEPDPDPAPGEYPLIVDYSYDPEANTMFVTIR